MPIVVYKNILDLIGGLSNSKVLNSGRPKRNNFGISVVSFRFVSFRFGSVRSRYTETELLSSFLPYLQKISQFLPFSKRKSLNFYEIEYR